MNAPVMAPARARRGRLVTLGLAAVLGVASLVAVLAAQRDQGLVRDELVYMHHGSRYADWWVGLLSGTGGMLTDDAITRHFGGPRATDGNREHPPLLKTLFGLSERLLHRSLGWTDRVTAYRVPSAVFHALLGGLVLCFAASIWGPVTGLIAGALALLLPRAFFHAGLAAFDAAMVTMWFATLFAYHRALRSRWWCLGLGICFGLALATKHNALMLPGVIGLHYTWVSWRAGRVARVADANADADAGTGRVRGAAAALWRGVRLRPLVLPALLIGPLVLVAVWPWLWFDTVAHAAAWIRFHLHHVHYNYEYLGRNWNAPPYPWHVPLVTTLLTVPVVTTAAAALGAGVVAVRARRGQPVGASADTAPVLLLALSAAVAMGPFLLGRAPIFGAEKHWAPAIPTLCILAGVGVVWAAGLAARALGRGQPARERLARGLATAILGSAVVAAALIETAAAHPYALSHYNALAGGAPGGADLGMNRQFWGYAARGVLPYLGAHAPAPGQPDRPVYTHDASPAWPMYREQGLLAPGLPDAGHERAGMRRSRVALVIHERHFNRHDYMVWDVYGTVQPAYVLTFQGVPLVSVYVRPAAGGAARTK